MRVLLAALLIAAATPAVRPQDVTATPARKIDRVDLLRAWLGAVDRHQPGSHDDAMALVGGWSSDELWTIREHFQTLVSLIREPDVEIFFQDVPGSRRTREMTYPAFELRELRALADEHGAVRSEDKCPREPQGPGRGINGVNPLLKRAALLHLEVAGAIATGRQVSNASPMARTDDAAFMLRVDDGRSLGAYGAPGHLEVGRELLDRVSEPCSLRPAPARDPWVRDWYVASLVHQLTQQQFQVRQVSRALELFRDDAEILALAGATHEALAAPLMQSAIGDNRALRDRLQLRSIAAEQARAEDLLRQALRRDDRHLEARLRLGHVLGLRGKHAEAVRELERVVAAAGDDRLIAYYARMLHGRELEAVGERQAARAAYEEASRLYAAAPAPRLAVSQLLRASGDASAALAMLERVVGGGVANDPWWEYHASAGRSLEQRVRALGAATPPAKRP